MTLADAALNSTKSMPKILKYLHRFPNILNLSIYISLKGKFFKKLSKILELKKKLKMFIKYDLEMQH